MDNVVGKRVLPALLLAAAAAPTARAGPAVCAEIRSYFVPPSSPWDGKALDASLQGSSWAGSFDSIRSDGLQYTGSVVNFITNDYIYQQANVVKPLSIQTYLTYCTINLTAVPSGAAISPSGPAATRYDVWWVLDTLPDNGKTVHRVQCMSLARINATLVSWQTVDGLCPVSTWPLPAQVTRATYVNSPPSGARASAALAAAALAAAWAAAVALL